MTERVELEFPDGRPPLTAASDVNTALAEVGAGVWRLDLTGARDNVRELLTRHTVTDEDTERLRANFLLPRERLLEIIAAAGRTQVDPALGQFGAQDPAHVAAGTGKSNLGHRRHSFLCFSPRSRFSRAATSCQANLG